MWEHLSRRLALLSQVWYPAAAVVLARPYIEVTNAIFLEAKASAGPGRLGYWPTVVRAVLRLETVNVSVRARIFEHTFEMFTVKYVDTGSRVHCAVPKYFKPNRRLIRSIQTTDMHGA